MPGSTVESLTNNMSQQRHSVECCRAVFGGYSHSANNDHCCAVLQRLVEEAISALENPLLVGQPLMPDEGGTGAEAAQNTSSTGGGIFMGT